MDIVTLATFIKNAKRPIIGCSFGKDSLVMLDMARKIYPNIEVLHLTVPYFRHKYNFASSVKNQWNLTVYDYPSSFNEYFQVGDMFDVVDYYYVADGTYFPLIRGCRKYKEGEKYVCAVRDLLGIPKVPKYDFKWDVIFFAQKDCDMLWGKYQRINPDYALANKKMFVFPVRDWSDEDILDYIKTNKLPYNEERYIKNNEDMNEDIIPACNNCLDYRMKGKKVFCPKLNREIDSIAQNEEISGKVIKEQTMLGHIREVN